MAVPAFLNSSHYYDSITSVDDVQDIIDALGTILKTDNDPAWTEPVAGTFQSPVDAAGRYYRVAVSAIDVDTLQLVVTDQYSNTVCTRRIDINASGSPTCEVKIYSGQYHLWIDSCLATYENFRSGILDLSPQTQNAWDTKVYGKGHRNSSGSVANQNASRIIIPGTGATDGSNDETIICPVMANGANFPILTDLVGNTMFWPVFCRNGNTGSVYIGRMYQVLIAPNTLGYGAEITVPIDTGVTAKFRVAGAPSGESPMTYYRFAVRAD